MAVYLTKHVDYPHEHGYLIDCPACESRCHCLPEWGECVFNGAHAISFPLPGKPSGLDGELQRHLNR
jgi:hypothetical protein